MKVVLIEPGKQAKIEEIDNGLRSMQKIVGGYIQDFPLDKNVDIICNDEGKINGLALNRALRDEDGDIYDIIAGTFFICSADQNGEYVSLGDELLKYYKHLFFYPESFGMLSNGTITAKPVGNMPKQIIVGQGEDKMKLMIVPQKYLKGESICLQAYCCEGSCDNASEQWKPYSTITTNIPDYVTCKNEILVKKGTDYGINWHEILGKLELIEPTGKTASLGFNIYNVYRLNLDRLGYFCGDELMESIVSKEVSRRKS